MASVQSADLTDLLAERIGQAFAEGRPLRIIGGGTKPFLVRPSSPSDGGDTLAVGGHCGIIDYDPAELVLTARTGTPLAEIESLLEQHGQMLAFEPPHFGSQATLGGTVACGLSGPRRPFAGSVRDSVLGCRMINGKGDVLSFGGRVMKNVAGFDVSRLMVGAMGTLGLLLEVSLKVAPRPEVERTLVFAQRTEEAISRMNRWCGQAWPLSGLAHDGHWTYLRLAGHESAVAAAQGVLGGDWAANGEAFWRGLREQRSRHFQYPPLGQRLWRFSVAPAAPVIDLPGHGFYDWAGALRWLRSDAEPEAVLAAARLLGGHVSLWRGEVPAGHHASPLTPVLRKLHLNLKQAFDPAGILNPGVFLGAG